MEIGPKTPPPENPNFLKSVDLGLTPPPSVEKINTFQGRAPGFRGEGDQVRDKTGIRLRQDIDKTETSQGQDKEKTGTR